MEWAEEHIKQVEGWLTENVRVYSAPKEVTITRLIYDENKREGTFDLYFDQQKIDERIGFMFEMAKKPYLIFPVYESPLGAPASYSQIDITYGTKMAIIKAVYRAYMELKESSNQELSENTYSETVTFRKKIGLRTFDTSF